MNKKDIHLMNFNKAREILELGTTFTPEQLKQNYHRLSLKCHPDKGGNSADFISITQAYEYLLDDKNTINVDPLKRNFETFNNINQNFTQTFNETFKSFIIPNINKLFTKIRTPVLKEIDVFISLREYLEGTVKEVTQTFKLNCGCEPVFCNRCRGFSVKTCEGCEGTGVMYNCGECEAGFTSHSRNITLNIPPKSKCISIPKDARFCSPEMKVNILVKKKKGCFIKDDKLYFPVEISLKESLVGFEKTFKDPFEKIHTITIDTIVQNNDGYAISDDIIIVFKVVYPTTINAIAKEKLNRIAF